LRLSEAPSILLPVVNLSQHVAKAVVHYWKTRSTQSKRQVKAGQRDQGFRGAVTGGAQMNGFIECLTKLIVEAGVDQSSVFCNAFLELPGYFRPTKKWDLLVVRNEQLLAALEVKSQAGPSFGNNFNNRTEEAMGSALDLWTAFREGAFNQSVRPWLGYVFHLEDCPQSRRPVRVEEPHFKVFPEFVNASYAQRYEWFCRKLMRERHYDGTAFLVSDQLSGSKGNYVEPAEDLIFDRFARSLTAHLSANWELSR
jgi:hypothetical protein